MVVFVLYLQRVTGSVLKYFFCILSVVVVRIFSVT